MSTAEPQKDPEQEQEDEVIQKFLSLSQEHSNLLVTPPPYVTITKLNLPNCRLSALPQGFDTAFPNLSILFLPKNQFTQVPAIVGKCPRLQMISFKENLVQSIHPDALQPQLRWLILTHNRLTSLPDELGLRCHKLQKCLLSGNQLPSVPETMKHCVNLELIRLASNRLTEPPMAILKHCPKLAWIGLSDNPFLQNIIESTASTSSLPSLELPPPNDEEDVILGRGAGGVTRKMEWQGRPVAVKEFSGAMTSDGLPATERRLACAAAALNCPALVQVLGETTHSGALVMEYLHGFVPLAGPPSMETCSRDVYDDSNNNTKITMTVQQAETMITRLLEALTALHKAGICHGDFYGHNILLQPDNAANVRLTDLGAACFYKDNSDNDNDEAAYYIQLSEIRAFCILTKEVVEHFLEAAPDLESPLLTELVDYMDKGIDEAAATSSSDGTENPITFESILVWLMQKQLSTMAKSFDPDNTLE